MKSPGDPENARQINTALILDQLRHEDLISRAQIARRLSLSKMTVSAIVNDLICDEIVVESGQGRAKESGGRRPILLTLNPSNKFVLGVDVGTTNTVVAVANLRGDLLVKRRLPTAHNHTVESILDQVAGMVEEARQFSEIDESTYLGMGLSVAGLVDRDAGLIALSPDLNWHDVPIRGLLEDRTGLSVVVDNCTRAMTLGERWYGAAQDVRNLFYVNVGYGIGSALVINGEIYAHNSEFGHFFITNQRIKCDCGNYGCLEAVASGQAIERKATELLPDTRDGLHTVQSLAQMCRQGNEIAASIFHDAGKYLGRAISYAANLYNPEKIIIGGGVALAHDLFSGTLLEEYRRHVMAGIRDTTEIEFSSLAMDAGVIGAVALALNSLVFKADHINHLL